MGIGIEINKSQKNGEKKPPDFKMKCFCLKPCDLFMIFHDIKYTKKERKPCSKGTSAIYLNNFFTVCVVSA